MSWFRLSNEALSIGQWQGINNISEFTTVHIWHTLVKKICISDKFCISIACANDEGAPCYQNGEEVLQSFGFDSVLLYEDLN